MNLLETYIKEIHSERDITDRYIKNIGIPLRERLIEVDITVDCYGCTCRVKKIFFESQWNTAKKYGVYYS